MNSAKSTLVKLFRFLLTPWEHSPSVQEARSAPTVFGRAAVKRYGGWFSLWATSWSLLQIPVCRQIEITFLTENDLNTMFFWNFFFLLTAVFAACQRDSEMKVKAIIPVLLSGRSAIVHLNSSGVCIKLCL